PAPAAAATCSRRPPFWPWAGATRPRARRSAARVRRTRWRAGAGPPGRAAPSASPARPAPPRRPPPAARGSGTPPPGLTASEAKTEAAGAWSVYPLGAALLPRPATVAAWPDEPHVTIAWRIMGRLASHQP